MSAECRQHGTAANEGGRVANSGLHAELTSLKLANGGRGATVSGRTPYKMLDGIELATDGADLGADLALLGRSWTGQRARRATQGRLAGPAPGAAVDK
jgi:hypothetical protein